GFAREYCEEYMLAYQVLVHGDFSDLIPRIKVGFFSDMPAEALPGYYWIFPKDDHTANIGVVCTGRGPGGFGMDLKALLKEVLEDEGLFGMSILKKGGGLIPARICSRLLHDNIILVGDAAGLTSALHGGGIDTACLSAILAVEAIVQGRQAVENYGPKLDGYLREKLAMERLLIEKMRTLNFEGFDDLLHAAAVRKPGIRTKVGLRHPDLLYAAWKWLVKKPQGLPQFP
ncbi:MAG: NAD(P)/FAD-dependent oxidoreductase, partial [Syntrophales bacterium]|nr:NAD(P)/FAD-dependent oxidoreductase [Syntrophales bacterium]